MTQNKIIAEFMDWTEDFDSITHEGNKWWSDPNTHKYHTSWDWLMPVVIKCFEVDDSVNDDLNFKLNDALLETNIDRLYKVVVEFIKNYKTI